MLPATGAALAALDRCFGVAPKLPELYSVQARVLKHAGDPAGAAAAAVKAQSLDLADRCLPVLAVLLRLMNILTATVPDGQGAEP